MPSTLCLYWNIVLLPVIFLPILQLKGRDSMELEKYKQLRTGERPLVHPNAKNNVKMMIFIMVIGILFLFGYMMYGVFRGTQIVTIKSNAKFHTVTTNAYSSKKDG